MNNLLIDVGSTFIKYSVYDSGKDEILLSDKTQFPEPIKNENDKYIVLSENIINIIKNIFDLTKNYTCDKAFFSVQMHGYLLKENDKALEHYISWRDKTGDISNEKFVGVDFDKYGTSLKTNLPLTKVKTENNNEFFTLGSYIAWCLTGNNATHITDACASGFFYADNGKPNEFCGNMIMPKVYKSVKCIGTYKSIKIFTPIGDHQISFLGSKAKENKYLLNIGTATQISCTAKKGYKGNYEKRPYFSEEKRLYTVSGLTGGYCINEQENIKKLIKEIEISIKSLPPKNGFLLGGGGAETAYEYIKNNNIQIKCELIKENIGMEGLKMIANGNYTKVGVMLSEITFPSFPIIAKNTGLNFMIIDAEHGAFDYTALSHLITNSNLLEFETIVRIGDSSRANVTKLSDMGVHGYLLPMTNCKEDIENIVKYAKYSPVGQRGISTTRAHTLYNPPKLTDYMKTANEKMKIYAQIETKSGVENIDNILSVNGVEGVFVGPNDLSADLDCIGQKEPILNCIKVVAEATKKMNKKWGIITADKNYLEFAKEMSVNMVSIGSELNMLIDGCKKIKESF